MLRTACLDYHKCYTLIVLHASRGLSKLRNKSWLNDLCGEDNAPRCRCAPIPLYEDWLVVSLINQVDSACTSVMCYATYLIAGWLLTFVGVARRHWSSLMQLLEDGERYRVVARRLDVSPSVVSRLWRRFQETEPRSLLNDNPKARPFSRLVVSTESNEYTDRALEIDFRRATAVRLSDQTVRSRLHQDGMRARRPARGPPSYPHCATPCTIILNFAHEHQNWQLRRHC